MTDLPNAGLIVRRETAADYERIEEINRAAFPTDAEARLVRLLRENSDPFVSLVALDSSGAVGHIAFSRASLDASQSVFVVGLAPMSVVPERQRQGIGARLANAGIDACRQLGVQIIIVLGHAEYYPKFGFVPASRWGVKSEYDVPDEAFMLLELDRGCLPAAARVARYHEAFAAIT
ncbi:MAG: N-acetyltransferase [Pseudomonadota bacterium]